MKAGRPEEGTAAVVTALRLFASLGGIVTIGEQEIGGYSRILTLEIEQKGSVARVALTIPEWAQLLSMVNKAPSVVGPRRG